MTSAELQAALAGGGELALLDVREQGVHHRGHPFFACSAPLSRLELVVGDLVPRRGAKVALLDGGAEGLAQKAAARLTALGYSEVGVLEGGCAAWSGAMESGFERATTTPDDVAYKPYDHGADYRQRARDYLDREVALVEQIKRDPAIRFRAY